MKEFLEGFCESFSDLKEMIPQFSVDLHDTGAIVGIITIIILILLMATGILVGLASLIIS